MNAKVDVSNVKLETRRLVLRPWKSSDLDDFYEYASVDGVGQMAGWEPHTSKDISKMILEEFIEEKITFAVEYKENHKVIGSIGIEELNPRMNHDELKELVGRELGYVLSKDYWGQGIMPEAINRVIEYCFLEEEYDFLMVNRFNRNAQSNRVIEKSGFTYYEDTVSETMIGTVEPGKMFIRYNDLLSKEA